MFRHHDVTFDAHLTGKAKAPLGPVGRPGEATLLGGRFTLRDDFPFLESVGAGRLELGLEDADFGPLLDEDLSLIATVLG